MKSRLTLQSPAGAALLAFACTLAFVVALWNARDRDLSRFIVLGALTVDESRLPRDVAVLPDSVGYDGTAFYRLALDPFTRKGTDFGIPLDMPAYRHQRILYPLLVWTLSLGQSGAVPAMLVFVNLVAIAALGFAGASLARHFGQAPLFGALVAFYPGFLYSVSRDLCEPVACAFALAAIVAVVKQRYVAGAVLLSCAILTRETFVIVAAACALAWLLGRVRGVAPRIAPVVFMLPLVVFAIWQLVLTVNWGVSPLRAGAHHVALTFPFADYWEVLRASSSLRRNHRLHFSEALYVGVVTLAAAAAWRKSASGVAWKLAWLGNLVLASTMISNVWREDVSYMRVLSDLHVLSGALILSSLSVIPRWVVAFSTAILWYYLATHLVKYS